MVFDEASWTLVVEGRQVDIETKPLEVLRELLLRPGEVVTKGELLDAVWPMVTVVEASLTTAVRKLRRAFGGAGGEDAVIETVSGLGYRLAVPVELEFRPVQGHGPSGAQTGTPPGGRPDPSQAHDAVVQPPRGSWSAQKWSVAGALVLALVGGGLVAARMAPGASPTAPPRISQADAKDALRALDLPRVETMLRQGWNPNTPFDAEGNGALNEVLNVCAWNPGHDKQKLLLVARTLYDAGARIDVRNVWGDTPYSIAAAKRYCGPGHPVTQMLREECYTGYNPPGDKCLAKYVAKR
jgi:DNA-binding winged helix-turn-helix (wHTH) protein